jgi:hypothetical protein
MLAVLNQKWELDPVKKASVQAGQVTPRYFKSSNNSKKGEAFQKLLDGIETDM